MSNNNKTPAIRFKGFTDTWEHCKLGEVTESIKNGYSYKADGSRDHTYKITRIESISTGVINTDKLGSSDEINESYKLQDGDILFSHINSLQYIANTALYTSNLGEIYHGMNLLNIRAKSNLINSHFLLHLLKIESNRDWFRTVAKPAVNQASISATEVGAFEFLLPNLKEQQVIADYFDNLDNLITLHQRKYDKLIQFKAAMLQKMFPQNGADKPEIRFKGFTDGWEQRELGKMTDITTGKLDANAMKDDGEYDFYTSGVKKYKIDVAAFEGPAITIAGNGATVGYMHLADGKFNAYQRTYVLSHFLEDRAFLFYEIGNKLPRKIAEEARTGNIPYIVLDMLTELNLSIPSLAEQQQIGTYFRNLDNLITLHQRKCDKYKSIKAGLIRKLFP